MQYLHPGEGERPVNLDGASTPAPSLLTGPPQAAAVLKEFLPILNGIRRTLDAPLNKLSDAGWNPWAETSIPWECDPSLATALTVAKESALSALKELAVVCKDVLNNPNKLQELREPLTKVQAAVLRLQLNVSELGSDAMIDKSSTPYRLFELIETSTRRILAFAPLGLSLLDDESSYAAFSDVARSFQCFLTGSEVPSLESKLPLLHPVIAGELLVKLTKADRMLRQTVATSLLTPLLGTAQKFDNPDLEQLEDALGAIGASEGTSNHSLCFPPDWCGFVTMYPPLVSDKVDAVGRALVGSKEWWELREFAERIGLKPFWSNVPSPNNRTLVIGVAVFSEKAIDDRNLGIAAAFEKEVPDLRPLGENSVRELQFIFTPAASALVKRPYSVSVTPSILLNQEARNVFAPVLTDLPNFLPLEHSIRSVRFERNSVLDADSACKEGYVVRVEVCHEGKSDGGDRLWSLGAQPSQFKDVMIQASVAALVATGTPGTINIAFKSDRRGDEVILVEPMEIDTLYARAGEFLPKGHSPADLTIDLVGGFKPRHYDLMIKAPGVRYVARLVDQVSEPFDIVVPDEFLNEVSGVIGEVYDLLSTRNLGCHFGTILGTELSRKMVHAPLSVIQEFVDSSCLLRTDDEELVTYERRIIEVVEKIVLRNGYSISRHRGGRFVIGPHDEGPPESVTDMMRLYDRSKGRTRDST